MSAGVTVAHSGKPDGMARAKLALMTEMARKWGQESIELQTAVRDAIRRAGSSAQEQMVEWERFCQALPYRREAGELYDSPVRVMQTGGDCDDLSILFAAGCVSLGLPCQMQLVRDAHGWPIHVRCLVGLPPLAPTHWIPVDPVIWSEQEWAMQNEAVTHPRAIESNQSPAHARLGGAGGPWRWLVLAATFWAGRWSMR